MLRGVCTPVALPAMSAMRPVRERRTVINAQPSTSSVGNQPLFCQPHPPKFLLADACFSETCRLTAGPTHLIAREEAEQIAVIRAGFESFAREHGGCRPQPLPLLTDGFYLGRHLGQHGMRVRVTGARPLLLDKDPVMLLSTAKPLILLGADHDHVE